MRQGDSSSSQTKPDKLKVELKKDTDVYPNAEGDDSSSALLLIKVLYVTYYLSNAVLHPFLPEFYNSRGYGSQVIGLIGSISPFTTFLVGPSWGIVTDSLQAPFLILFTTISISIFVEVLVSVVTNSYLVMFLVGVKAVVNAPVRSIIDSLVIQQLKDRSEFGKMRLWGLIGAGLGTTMGGILVEGVPTTSLNGISSQLPLLQALLRLYNKLAGYPLLFFAYVILQIPVFLALLFFQKNQRERTALRARQRSISKEQGLQQRSMKEVGIAVFKDREAVIFFGLVCWMGVAGGIADNFTYARFREIGASTKNMGYSRLFSSAAGALMFWFSGPLRSLLGTENVFILSLLIVALRFHLYAVMNRIWYAYLGEGLRGMTFGFFWSAATVYCSELAPEDARSTMLLLLNGAYNGVGRSAGALVGGRLHATTGGTQAIFRYFTIVFLCLSAVFAAYMKLQVSRSMRRAKERMKTKDE